MNDTARPIIGVGAMVIRPDGSVLLGYRDKPGETPCWCLPGGHVDAGESFETSAVREVAEETGITELPLSTRSQKQSYASKSVTVSTLSSTHEYRLGDLERAKKRAIRRLKNERTLLFFVPWRLLRWSG